MKISALILARGNSKSIPGKNIKRLNGVPLICRSLAVVVQCDFFEEVWVSTDCQQIAHVVKKHFPSVQVHMRSDLASDDNASSLDAVTEFWVKHEDIEAIGLIQCTSPCLGVAQLREACNKLLAGYDSAFSVYRDRKLRWIEKEPGQMIALNFNPRQRPRRQDMQGELTESGHFYFFTKELISNEGLLQSLENGSYVEMPEDMCIEIDDPHHWSIAEVLAKAMDVD